MNEAPVRPRPAATVILLRAGAKHGSGGLEVLLVRRSPEARFMPGAWVFPGGAVDPVDGDDAETSHRNAAVRELAEEAAIELAGGDALVPFSRWITPAQLSVRFDTRFFLAKAPPHAKPREDGDETVEAAWFNPNEVLASHHKGELVLMFPTLKHLEVLAPFESVADALASAPTGAIEAVEPRVIEVEGKARIVLPGEQGYD